MSSLIQLREVRDVKFDPAQRGEGCQVWPSLERGGGGGGGSSLTQLREEGDVKFDPAWGGDVKFDPA